MVQIYTRQDVAFVSQPEKQLRGFARITLEPQQSGVARILIDRDSLSYHDRHGIKQQAQGTLSIMAGLNSRDVQSVKYMLPNP